MERLRRACQRNYSYRVVLASSAAVLDMTYMVDGEQYIALTVSSNPPQLLAFKLAP